MGTYKPSQYSLYNSQLVPILCNTMNRIDGQGERSMNSEDYEYLPLSKVQCPKCGTVGEIALCGNTGYSLEYSGVCGSQSDAEVICGAFLTLRVTAHLFPVQQT